jgi:hypothetical protein
MNQLTDLSPLNWIGESTDQDAHPESIWGFVSEYLPVNYPAYCKIFHAIYEDTSVPNKSITWDEVGNKGIPDDFENVTRITWQDLATKYGLEYHAEINEASFTENFPKGSWPRYLLAAVEGTLDEDECSELVALLALVTNGQQCCFYYDPVVRSTEHDFVGTLFTGDLADVDELSSDGNEYAAPTYWWPEDRSWTVFTDPGYVFTLVGGSQELIDSILKSEHLEAVTVELTTRITPNSDDINIQDDQTEKT